MLCYQHALFFLSWQHSSSIKICMCNWWVVGSSDYGLWALHWHRTGPDLQKWMTNKCAGGMQDMRFCPRVFQLRSPPILFQFRFCAYQRLTQTQTLEPCCQREGWRPKQIWREWRSMCTAGTTSFYLNIFIFSLATANIYIWIYKCALCLIDFQYGFFRTIDHRFTQIYHFHVATPQI